METAIEETLFKLKTMAPEHVRLDTSLGHLRDQTPRWLFNTHKVVSQTTAVELSWSRSCKVRARGCEFNLSYESLTSREMWQYIDALPETDPDFARILMHPRSLRTMQPRLEGHKVIVEAYAPGEALPQLEGLGDNIQQVPEISQDGSEIETRDLIQMMYGNEVDAPIGATENGFFYYTAPEEDTNYGYREGFEVGGPAPRFLAPNQI